MHLDKFGLPTQNNGDAYDQLQRVGMIGVGEKLSGTDLLETDPTYHLKTTLQPSKGIYVRYNGGDTRNVSGDQLVPVFATWLVYGNMKELWNVTKAMLLRGGFAQNTLRIHDNTEKKKIPDFLLIRVLPIITRASKWLAPLRYIADLTLLLAVMFSVWPWRFNDDALLPRRKTDDDVDDNNLIVTLVTTQYVRPTFISRFAVKFYAKNRMWNRGCRGFNPVKLVIVDNMYHPVQGALRWYHRGGAGGNPEIADFYALVVDKYILDKKVQGKL